MNQESPLNRVGFLFVLTIREKLSIKKQITTLVICQVTGIYIFITVTSDPVLCA